MNCQKKKQRRSLSFEEECELEKEITQRHWGQDYG